MFGSPMERHDYEQHQIALHLAVQAKVAEELEASRKAMRQTGACCQVTFDSLAARGCGVIGAGRCRGCKRVFCQSHQSSAPAQADLCLECERAAAMAAQQAETDRVAAKRREQSRERIEHQRRVAQNEAAGPGRQVVVAKRGELERRISRCHTLLSSARAFQISLVLYVISMILLSQFVYGDETNVVLGYLIPAIAVFGISFGARTIFNARQRAEADRSLREWMLLRHATGCGDHDCWTCYPSRYPTSEPLGPAR